jgi:hypothetical protein
LVPNGLPRKCNHGGSLSEGMQKREQYARALPLSYLGSLFAASSNTTKFLVGTQIYVLLLFTYGDSQHAYIITPREGGITAADVITLDFNTEYLFHIRFHSDGHKELHQERFKFIAKSWDDITFQGGPGEGGMASNTITLPPVKL